MWRVVACAATLLAAAEGNIIVYTQKIPHEIAEEFRDMPASFGGNIPDEGLRGFLVAGEPEHGCSTLAPPPPTDNFTGKWIVLVARYNCSFEVKVRNAQAAGYDCAIVHNVNSSDLETMSAKNDEGILIPSVFVSDLAGLMLAGEYTFNNGYYLMVNGDLPFNINTHLLLPFAIVVVLCMLVILILMIVKCIKDRRRARRHRLPNRCLKKIPTCKFSKGDPYETCAICLDDYQEGERLRVLPCAHAYHAKCIDPWLTQNRRVCPVCKRRVFAAGERRARHDTGSDTDDTEPLINDASNDTQGGTFEEQHENPFRRAARFMARLRGRPAPPDDARDDHEAPTEDNNDALNQNNEHAGEDDTAPLVSAVVQAEAERPAAGVGPHRERGRRHRHRARRTRSASAPLDQQNVPTVTQLLRSDDHSINNANRGEIGVAAIPAMPTTSQPHHIDL